MGDLSFRGLCGDKAKHCFSCGKTLEKWQVVSYSQEDGEPDAWRQLCDNSECQYGPEARKHREEYSEETPEDFVTYRMILLAIAVVLLSIAVNQLLK